MNSRLQGSIAAVSAFILWGILPVYWKLLQESPPYEILCHRMVWSLVFTTGLMFVLGRRSALLEMLRHPFKLPVYMFSSVLLGCNWLLYIWAVNSGYVLETSLGYFINPLILVVFGFVFFQERLRPGQYAALFVAFCGVIFLTVVYGKFPWVALSLAVSFGIYGLLHKKSDLPALDGLCFEAMMLFLPALGFLVFWEWNGNGSFFMGGRMNTLLFIGTGFATSFPLLLFGFAAKHIPLTMLGLFQYIAPTISLFLGIFLYHEDFPPERLAGFSFIWCALVLYRLEGMWQKWKQGRYI